MINSICVYVIVEGKTEELFLNNLVIPYLSKKNIYMYVTQVSKPGKKGGDVRFARVKNDLKKHLTQRSETYVSLFIDYYGLKPDWPGLETAKAKTQPNDIAKTINEATKKEVIRMFGDNGAEKRFIPFVAVHEFEALLFSDSKKLAAKLQVKQAKVDAILSVCGSPEEINDNPQTAPSKRLEALYPRYKKTTTGITIASDIGIEKMRSQCSLFDNWLKMIEGIHEAQNG